MLNFTSFLYEEAHSMQVAKPVVHLVHPEDAMIDHGHDGVYLASNFLDRAHHMLSGAKGPKEDAVNWSIKHDGAPSLIFGMDPHDKQFFASTKSIGNKSPLINKTPEDVINNHGHKPELAKKLILGLKHLPKIMPEGGGIFQGDFMHSKADREKDKTHIHFQPNTIKYSAPRDSAHGAAAESSHMGIAIHTAYSPEGVPYPLDNKMRKKFKQHPHVDNIHTGLQIKPSQYTPGDIKNYLDLRDQATKHYRSMPPDVFDVVSRFTPQIHKYINHEVRREGQPSARGFGDYLNQLHSGRMDNINNEKWAKERIRTHAGELSDVLGNAHNLEKVFKLHSLMGGAKNVLTDVMGRNMLYSHSINGEPTGPEGVVAVAPTGSAVKFVNRKEFSAKNFHNGKFNEKL